MAAQTKAELHDEIVRTYNELSTLIEATEASVLTSDFAPAKVAAKCTTFEQGNNMRDILMHIFDWQRMQADFVGNIRSGQPKDFIPEPYRKDYKELERINFEKAQAVPFDEAWSKLKASHEEMLTLLDGFTDEELFAKKVFKVTYTTTMGCYFMCCTTQPYGKAVKKLKAHIKASTPKKK